MRKEYVIYNQRLAGFLMQSGFVLKRMEKTKNENSNRNVFIFNNTDELIEKLNQYNLSKDCK